MSKNVIKGHISNVIAMANSIKLKLPGMFNLPKGNSLLLLLLLRPLLLKLILLLAILILLLLLPLKLRLLLLILLQLLLQLVLKLMVLRRKIWNVLKLYGTKSKHTLPTQIVKRAYQKFFKGGWRYKLKFSACFEGDVEETKGPMRMLLLLLLQLLLLRKPKVLSWCF